MKNFITIPFINCIELGLQDTEGMLKLRCDQKSGPLNHASTLKPKAMTSITKNTTFYVFFSVILKTPFKYHLIPPRKRRLRFQNNYQSFIFQLAKLAMKIVEYLALFVVEHDVQKVLLHLVYAVLKSMVNLDQLVIVIMAIANHQGLRIPSLQILKSNLELIQSIL